MQNLRMITWWHNKIEVRSYKMNIKKLHNQYYISHPMITFELVAVIFNAYWETDRLKDNDLKLKRNRNRIKSHKMLKAEQVKKTDKTIQKYIYVKRIKHWAMSCWTRHLLIKTVTGWASKKHYINMIRYGRYVEI